MTHKYQLPGLTLVEMIVSISMIAIITSVFVANYHSTNKRTDLIMTAQNLVSDIHWAQNNTLGLVKYNAAVPAAGWGVSFSLGDNPNGYVVFADLNAPGQPGYLDYDDNTEGVVAYGARRVSLSDKIIVSDLKVGESQVSVERVNVTFLPPDPVTNIYYDSSATSTVLEIELTEVQSGSKKTVQVNFLGLAEVID